MNENERLYSIKLDIDEKIRKHKLFKMPKREAIYCLFEKVGVLFRMLLACKNKVKQEYMKSKIHTNATYIDDVDFMQESLKWICRWCLKYCQEEAEDYEKIYADDIFELMGLAYSYEKFYTYWELHRAKIVKYCCERNVITFYYICEETHQIHELYDTISRKITDNEVFTSVLQNRSNKVDNESFELIQRADFNLGYNFNFGEFTLKDYEEFSVVLNNYIVDGWKKRKIVIPGEEGIWRISVEELCGIMLEETSLQKNAIEGIIKFFMYDFNDKYSDLSLTYFIPLEEGRVAFSEGIFYMQRPAINALRVLAKKQSSLYAKEQNIFESKQKEEIKNNINEVFKVAGMLSKEQKLRSGMDSLVYDEKNNHLQVIELKYKIPIESVRDTTNLDDMLEKAYGQIEKAKVYINQNKETILKEYFGERYQGIVPDKIDFFVVTNYSVGTGNGCKLPTPVLLEEHYLEMMRKSNGMQLVHDAVKSIGKLRLGSPRKRYARYIICDYKIKIPESLIERSNIFI